MEQQNKKVKIGLGKDKNFNYAYYRVIGEMDEFKQPYFVMKGKRGTPHPTTKFSLFRKEIHLYTKGTLIEQESVFKVINRDNANIYLVELVDDEK